MGECPKLLERDEYHWNDLTTILANEIETFMESNNGSPYEIFNPKSAASAHTPYFSVKLLPLKLPSYAASGAFSPRVCSSISRFSISGS
jgi:hypothetical protein